MTLSCTLDPRPYQIEARRRWVESVKAGRLRGAFVKPTGCGKTSSALLVAAGEGLAQKIGDAETVAKHSGVFEFRTLWITHREELIDQTASTALDMYGKDVDVGIVKAERNEVNARDLVIASIQTICKPKRLEQLLASGKFDLVIVDEFHHAAAKSYLAVIDHPQLVDTPCLGLSATPSRNDDKGLAKIWGPKPVFHLSLNAAFDGGWLVPFHDPKTCHGDNCRGCARRVKCDIDYSKLKINADGDFDPDEAEKEEIRADVASAIAEEVASVVKIEKLKTVVFTPSVNQAERVTKVLQDLGVRVAMISGNTPAAVRKEIRMAFRRGDLQVLCNCMLLTEGWDEPSVQCIAMARATQSETLYRQIAGRGFRLHPGKAFCLIIDLVGAHGTHGITAEDLLDEDEGEPEIGKKTSKKKPIVPIGRDGEFGLVKSFAKATSAGVNTKGKKRRARVKWLEVAPDIYALTAGEHGNLVLRKQPGEDDKWLGYRLPKDAWGPDELRPVMNVPTTLEFATGVMEDRARKLGVFGLSNEKAEWREKDPNPKQIEIIVNMCGPNQELPKTRGEASDLITLANLKKIFRQGAHK